MNGTKEACQHWELSREVETFMKTETGQCNVET
jgi:hypothetical protein